MLAMLAICMMALSVLHAILLNAHAFSEGECRYGNCNKFIRTSHHLTGGAARNQIAI